MRLYISTVAFLVNVSVSISSTLYFLSSTRCANRSARTLVFPEPAPALTTALRSAVTAAFCAESSSLIFFITLSLLKICRRLQCTHDDILRGTHIHCMFQNPAALSQLRTAAL